MTIITTVDELGEVLALALEIEITEGLPAPHAWHHALLVWSGLRLDVEADVRYLPTGQTIRPHVSLAAGVPALELA
jgi:hypothetical protein